MLKMFTPKSTFFILLSLLVSSCSNSRDDSEADQTHAAEELVPFEDYYPDGTLKGKGTERNGRPHGIFTAYYESGAKWMEKEYADGIQEGRDISWFENGKRKHTGQLKNGLETGEWTYYDDINDSVRFTCFYENGKMVSYTQIAERHRWRPIVIGDSAVLVSFPGPISGRQEQNGIDARWALLPYLDKSELEFYSVSVFPAEQVTHNLDTLFMNVDKDSLGQDLQELLSGGGTTEEIPTLKGDAYEVQASEIKMLQNIRTYFIDILFTEYDLYYSHLILPVENNVYVISAYYNKTLQKEIREHFFGSVRVDR